MHTHPATKPSKQLNGAYSRVGQTSMDAHEYEAVALEAEVGNPSNNKSKSKTTMDFHTKQNCQRDPLTMTSDKKAVQKQ